ncbi:hypothetical protein [Nodularia sphaerocarpa]|uniref:hypothetical protein n=1 Tax=Nodularia sphaerocarpa TaxID=137816 RepID=UPI001EFA5B60|nr:hypothetical protein [Nodularia sphaerocarpa]MDB9373531.1 hypothetical protein [Nodularia sphaerocarpa CS-585]MDB9377669.1 hypothetical protein [Nodularia sphaerocarpa CS-585A2]ULP70630.1 hypothetical protein BDGGKGIB_00246 [Nodularia sphaerocarpa UHCC 0038]
MLNIKYKLGELNPQLLRELKGRLKIRNALLAISTSLLGQFILFMGFQAKLPQTPIQWPDTNTYCTGESGYNNIPKCVLDNYGHVIINWQLWYQDVFHLLSFMAIFAMLVAGTYLLINDLATEERRDTLNFIRLSPQSPQSILLGKMLGVPILLYVVILLAIPLHFWLGLNAKIPLNQILTFYVILLAASILYYSGALLFGLIGSWLGGFQSWLGSAFVLVFLVLNQEDLLSEETAVTSPLIALRLIIPQSFIPNSDSSLSLADLHWFGLPLGNSLAMIIGFTLLIYFMGIYFIWQSLQRCYRDPNATMLSKQQSYLLTTSFTIITLGCANLQNALMKSGYYSDIKDNLLFLMCLNFWLFLYLIAALMPNRQTLQDWARYQHIYRVNHPGKRKLVKDLVWGEKSPGVLAIAINALIVVTSISVWLFVPSSHGGSKISAFAALIFAFSLVIIYAALAQLLLFMKNEQRLLWTNGIVGAVIILPPIVLFMLFSDPSNQSFLWFFSIVAPSIFLFPPTNYSLNTIASFFAIVIHAGILSLLLFQTKRQLQKAGESATKALLTPN